MARRRKKTFGIGWILALIVLTVGAAASVAYYSSRGSAPATVQAPENHASAPMAAPTAPRVRRVTIFLPESSGDQVYLAPVTRTTTMKGDLVDVALRTLLAAGAKTGDGEKLIPQGTELLYPVKIADGVATVDLSAEFVDDFSGGTALEALTLNSIAETLVSNSDGRVSKIQILVEGQTVDTLGGAFSLKEPYSVNSSMVKVGRGN